MSNKTQLNVIIQFVWHSLLHYCLIALLDVKYTETLLRIPYLHNNTSIKLFFTKGEQTYDNYTVQSILGSQLFLFTMLMCFETWHFIVLNIVVKTRRDTKLKTSCPTDFKAKLAISRRVTRQKDEMRWLLHDNWNI